MINRINLILQAKNITAKQFAEEIGIQPSGMSHILGGRNNPSLDFVTKVIRRYPEIDANWLLLGRGEMYGGMGNGERKVEDGEYGMAREGREEPTLFGEEEGVSLTTAEPRHEPMTQQEAIAEEERQTRRNQPPAEPAYVPSYIASAPAEKHVSENVVSHDNAEMPGRKLVRLLFIYDDNTFEEYSPC